MQMDTRERGHTPQPWAADSFALDFPPRVHIRSASRHWSVCVAHQGVGCTDPSMDISEAEARANAELIVRAVNAYPALVGALDRLERCSGRLLKYFNPADMPEDASQQWQSVHKQCANARDALALALSARGDGS